MRRELSALMFLPLLGASSCSEVGLCKIPCNGVDLPPADNRIDLEGTACTLDPDAVVYPYKVLFVIDVSGSNQNSDPDDNRARAVQAVIDQYIENRSVSFGVLTFNDEAELQTPRFTRNYDLLVPDVMTALRVKDGATNYLDTVDLAYEFIEEDILATPEGERARTRYDIQWLSDGIPDPCQRPGPVLEQTERLVELRERYGLFDLVVNTTQLVYPNSRYDVEGCNDVFPGPDYLAPMSEIGDGTFRQLAGGELEFTIGFTEILRAFEQRHFFVVNTNTVVWDDVLEPDTDGDGVFDTNEAFEPDPLLADHDADGCSDRVDVEMLPNVGLCKETCGKEMRESNGDPSTLVDLDADGLPDCAEKVLGYLRTRADSDLDGFPDLIELKAGTNPLEGQPLEEDQDGDGVSDGDEMRLGTNPRWPESPDAREMLGYRYEPLYPVPGPVVGSSCFEFRVENVRLAQTMATPDREAGENRVCVYIVQTPLDDPNSAPVVTRSCKTARYLATDTHDLKEPANGILSFTPLDFGVSHTGPVSDEEEEP